MQPEEQFIKKIQKLQGNCELVSMILSLLDPVVKNGNFQVSSNHFNGRLEDENGIHILKIFISKDKVDFINKVSFGSVSQLYTGEYYDLGQSSYCTYNYTKTMYDGETYDIASTSLYKELVNGIEKSQIFREEHCQYVKKFGRVRKIVDFDRVTSSFRSLNDVVLEKEQSRVYNPIDNQSICKESYLMGSVSSINTREIPFSGIFNNVDKETFEKNISNDKNVHVKKYALKQTG